MGKPIIASDVPMIREFIFNDDTGILVPAGDARALREAIVFLHERPDVQCRLGQNARRYFEANLSMKLFADRYADCIRNVVARRPGAELHAEWRVKQSV